MLARRMNKDAKNSKEFVKFTLIPANETLLSGNGEEQMALLPVLKPLKKGVNPGKHHPFESKKSGSPAGSRKQYLSFK